MDNRDMRRAEEIEVLQRLFGITGLVASRDAQRVVELEAAFAAPFQVDAAIFARKREVAAVWPAAGCGRIDHVAEPDGRRARRDLQTPGLAVAPGRGLLRSGENAFEGRTIHVSRQEGVAGKALCHHLLDDADALLHRVLAVRRSGGVRHLSVPWSESC